MIWAAVFLACGAGYAVGGLLAIRGLQATPAENNADEIDAAYAAGLQRGRQEGKTHE